MQGEELDKTPAAKASRKNPSQSTSTANLDRPTTDGKSPSAMKILSESSERSGKKVSDAFTASKDGQPPNVAASATMIGEEDASKPILKPKAENYQVWNVIEVGDFEVTKTNAQNEVIPKPMSEYQKEDFDKMEINAMAVKLLHYGLKPHEHNRVMGCKNAKEIWDFLQITHEGTNEVRKVLRSLPQDERWRAKVTALQETKDFTKFNIEQLTGSLITHELHLGVNNEPMRNKGLTLKADEEEDTEVDEDEASLIVRRFKKMFKKGRTSRNFGKKTSNPKPDYSCHKCGSPNNFIRDCPLWENDKGKGKAKEQGREKFSKANFQKSDMRKVMIAAWGDSESEEEDDDQPEEETTNLCLMATSDDEKAYLEELQKEVFLDPKQLKTLSKDVLIDICLEEEEFCRDTCVKLNKCEKALKVCKEHGAWLETAYAKSQSKLRELDFKYKHITEIADRIKNESILLNIELTQYKLMNSNISSSSSISDQLLKFNVDFENLKDELSTLKTQKDQLESELNARKDRSIDPKVIPKLIAEAQGKRTEGLVYMTKRKGKQKKYVELPSMKVLVRGNNSWYLDCGCSKHMTGDKSKFLSLEDYPGGTVTFGDNKKGEIIGKGKIGRSKSHSIDNVFLVKGLMHNLLSISQFCDKGNSVSFTSDSCNIINNKSGKVVQEGARRGNTYKVDLNLIPRNNLTCLSVVEDDPLLWHKRFGHASFSLLDKLRSRNLVVGLPIIKFLLYKVCDACVKGKHVCSSFKLKKRASTTNPLELIHMDLCGPMRIQSRSGKKYVLVIVDDYSRFTWFIFLSSKDETFNEFVAFSKKIQKISGHSIVHLRSDHGTEFENSRFDEFCRENGMNHNFSAPRTPQQNGVVERKNQTLEEMARTMLIASGLPRNFWAKAVNTACYILNRVTIRSIINKTLYELFRGRKPNISHLRAFGCKCFVHNNGKKNLGKFDERSEEAIFLGYASNSKAYREKEDDNDFEIGLIRDMDEEETQKQTKEKYPAPEEDHQENGEVPQPDEQVNEEQEEEAGGTDPEAPQIGVPAREFQPRPF
ncbi:uncharacterized protein LOC110715354 [Chenopodium quinoa]|uniref:uncharacterized protein LOC110715354 n=1 Tax=Chenopodium quinoa TaxID=63459 RepID=UPI000B776D2F|nr:uncharacterized protein LOC110715354 [Chenopodium quinoa]